MVLSLNLMECMIGFKAYPLLKKEGSGLKKNNKEEKCLKPNSFNFPIQLLSTRSSKNFWHLFLQFSSCTSNEKDAKGQNALELKVAKKAPFKCKFPRLADILKEAVKIQRLTQNKHLICDK